MAERPTPRSIAICALIALESDNTSPLHEVDELDKTKLSHFLEESVFESSNSIETDAVSTGDSSPQSLKKWLNSLRSCVGEEAADLVRETLELAVDNSIDGLVDLMESLRAAILAEGLVDAVSAHGVFLRQVGLGYDELSFESTTLLWQELAEQLRDLDSPSTSSLATHAISSWPLSPNQLEAYLRQECLRLEKGTSTEPSFEKLELQIRELLEHNSELPAAHFLRYLNCLREGERVGALESLHHYFDHSMVGTYVDGADILQFSAILLAMTHHSFGDAQLSLMATEEAVRVAQQSKDAACVAFALGWLFENHQSNTAVTSSGLRRELLQRCAARATMGQLRPLRAGANLSLARHRLREDLGTQDTYTIWNHISEVTTVDGDATIQTVDRPTFLSTLPNETMESIARQRLVSAGIWDSFGVPALSKLTSNVALLQPDALTSEDILVAIQNISRLALFGTPATPNSTAANPHPPIGPGAAIASPCIYADAIETLIQLRERFALTGKRVEESVNRQLGMLLHEWAVCRCDLADANALGITLESYLYPGMSDYDGFVVDVRLQGCLRLGRQKSWDKAREQFLSLLELCQTKSMVSQRARVLVHLASLELESNPNCFLPALSPVLEALCECKTHEMHGLHAVALSVLAEVFLRLHNPKRSLAVLKGILPTMVQREHVWFQGQAFLVRAKCHLELAQPNQDNLDIDQKNDLHEAFSSLERSRKLFEKCQDAVKLREIFYWEAQIHSYLQQLNERESKSQRFLSLNRHIVGQSNSSPFRGILTALQDSNHMADVLRRRL